MVFKNQKCLDCGATGDSRLMPKYCHMEPVYIHPGNIVQYHPKGSFDHWLFIYTCIMYKNEKSINILFSQSYWFIRYRETSW